MAEKASFLIDVKAKGVEQASGKFNNLNKNVNGLSSSVKKLAVVFGVGFLGKQLFDAGRGAISTAAQFETLRVRLGNMYGSVQRGTQAFDAFNKVAATTPFQLANVVEAGAALKAFGADAEEMIKPVSDLAAFMGTDVVDAANAMGRAFAGGAGAADVLREKGILQLIKDTQGFADLSKITLPEFRDAMVKTLSDPNIGIAGATTKLAETWNGTVSNFQDGVDRFKAAIGEKLIEKLKPLVTRVNQELSRLGEIGWDNIAQSLMDNTVLLGNVAGRAFSIVGEILGIGLSNGIKKGINSGFSERFETPFKLFGVDIKEDLARVMSNVGASEEEIEAKLGERKSFLPIDTESTSRLFEELQLVISDGYAQIIEQAQEYNNTKKEIKEAEVKIEKEGAEKVDVVLKQSLKDKLKVNSQLLGSLASLNKAAAGSAKVTARIQQSQAVIDTYGAATAAVAPPPRGYGPNPLGYAAAAAAIAGGLANVVQIEKSMKSFATGGSFVTGGDELIRVGDNPTGREIVNVTPLDAAGEPTGGGGMITVNVSGNVMSENYTEDVIIPHIKEALRRGESIA